jgi:hypothetical protein
MVGWLVGWLEGGGQTPRGVASALAARYVTQFHAHEVREQSGARTLCMYVR